MAKASIEREIIIIGGEAAAKLTEDDGYYCKSCKRVHKLSSIMYSIHELYRE